MIYFIILVTKYSIKPNVFIRHFSAKSLIWCPRTGGCSIFNNARYFLDAFTKKAQTRNSLIKKISQKIGVSVDKITEDFDIFLNHLLQQGFIENHIQKNDVTAASFVEGERDSTYSDTVLYDFIRKKHFISDLHIDLTNACTEHCIHCYIPKGLHNFIPLSTVFKVLKEFRKQNGLTVMLSGGECMLHPNFLEICKKCVDLNINYVVMSNLTVCNSAIADFLSKYQPQFVNVSVYSMVAEHHDYITGLKGSLKHTIDAIETLCAAGVPVRISMPLMKQNKNDISGVHRFAEKKHLHLIIDYDLFGEINQSCENLKLCSLDLQELEAILRIHKNIINKKFYVTRNSDEKVCNIGENSINLSSTGNFYPCDGFHGMILGKAEADSLSSVWKGQQLQVLRSLKIKDFGECTSCDKRLFCKICPMRNFNETGDMLYHRKERCNLATINQEFYGEQK